MIRNKLFALFGAIMMVCLSLLGNSAHAAGNDLGLAVEVLPSDDPAISRITTGQSLWFVIAPGKSQSRSARIVSSSNIPERISLSLGFLERVNGAPIVNDNKVADSKKWASFSPNNFVLKPHSAQVVTFTYTIPDGAEIGTHEAYLHATASQVASNSSAQYKMAQNARIATPVFLGVGTSDQIVTKFEIVQLDGVYVGGVRNLRIYFKNTGKTPIRLSGSADMKSLDFENLSIKPIFFNTVTIQPGTTSFVLAPTPQNVVPGRYTTVITANTGSLTQTRQFTNNLTFKEPAWIIKYGPRIAIVLLFLLLLIALIRFLKRSKPSKNEGNPENDLGMAKALLRTKRSSRKSKESDEEIDAMLEAILARHLESRKQATKKKAPVKKATTKKAVAKKAAAKKTIAKKNAPAGTAKKSTKKSVKKTAKKVSPKKR